MLKFISTNGYICFLKYIACLYIDKMNISPSNLYISIYINSIICYFRHRYKPYPIVARGTQLQKL